MKRRLRSKTYWLASTVAGMGALQLALPSMQEFMDKRDYAIAMIVIAVLVAMAREFTSEPVRKGKEE